MRGPARKPTDFLKLTNPPKAAKRAKTEPKPMKGPPTRPIWITGEARKHWERTVPALQKMGVLSKIDGAALARYCDHWAQWMKAREWIMSHGTTYAIRGEPTQAEPEGPVKCFMPWPQLTQYNKLSTQLLRLEQEFGLTPAARSRIILNPPKTGAGSPYINRGAG